MITKIIGVKDEFKCISCGKGTPAIFVVRDTNGKEIVCLPLCRECSDKFAEDKLLSRERKLAEKTEKIAKKTTEIKVLKTKIRQMNIISHSHKAKIAELRNKEKENSDYSVQGGQQNDSI